MTNTSNILKSNQPIPPVITVLGHVDHGKTTLLDAIRSSSIAEREFGGITQKIGASTVEVMHEGSPRPLTFLDTPGHLAFANMRSRGAQVADIGLLIVSAVDGVMPQTKESIQVLLAAKIPFIVVLTKVDLPNSGIDKVKQQLLRENILLEGMGGDVPVIEVSAKTGKNIKELLDLILLVFDLHHAADESARTKPLQAVVIESRLDPKSGPKASIVVKQGTINVRDTVFTEEESLRVRMLIDDTGKQVQSASVGQAVELLGFTKVPGVGSKVTGAKAEAITQQPSLAKLTKDLYYHRPEESNELALILCADTEGSLEAIRGALPKENLKVVASKTGEVSEADIMLAKSTGALVLSFNSRIRPEVAKLAATEKVLAKNYQIIYEMLDEIKDVLEGKAQALLEEIYGTAKILGKFPFENTYAMGLQIMEGRVARGDRIRIVRGDSIVGESTLTSLRVGKEPTSKVERGEAGAVINPLLDFQIGDVLLSHS